MATILSTIIEHKREEVKKLSREKTGFAGGRTDTKRPFAEALNIRPQLALIGEVKKASPSKGVIRADYDPVPIAESYEQAQANAVSVLTDERFFQGSLQHLKDIRAAVALPVLRKEFIIDPLQVQQSAHANADALLLIAAALSDSQMEELYAASNELDVDVLIEVHDCRELDRVMKLSPPLVGINNRNLETFEVSLSTTVMVLAHCPQDIAIVSESGIVAGEDTRKLMEAGVSAVLVGEALMRSEDPAALIKQLRHI
jgi:indole-3-glycerol phosphate synthase